LLPRAFGEAGVEPAEALDSPLHAAARRVFVAQVERLVRALELTRASAAGGARRPGPSQKVVI